MQRRNMGEIIDNLIHTNSIEMLVVGIEMLPSTKKNLSQYKSHYSYLSIKDTNKKLGLKVF